MVSMFWAKTIKIPKFHGHIFEIAKSGLSGLKILIKNYLRLAEMTGEEFSDFRIK